METSVENNHKRFIDRVCLRLNLFVRKTVDSTMLRSSIEASETDCSEPTRERMKQ